jgi:hypothetical protein
MNNKLKADTEISIKDMRDYAKYFHDNGVNNRISLPPDEWLSCHCILDVLGENYSIIPTPGCLTDPLKSINTDGLRVAPQSHIKDDCPSWPISQFTVK